MTVIQRLTKQPFGRIRGAQREHHRKIIRYSLSHRKFIEEQISEIDQHSAAQIQEAGLDRQ
jgi:hypothetical protein